MVFSAVRFVFNVVIDDVFVAVEVFKELIDAPTVTPVVAPKTVRSYCMLFDVP